MRNSLDLYPENSQYRLNILTPEIVNTFQDNYGQFSTFDTTRADDDLTFRKTVYSEDDHDYFLSHAQLRNAHSNAVFPRPPGKKWNLKLLLHELSKEISEDDLEIFKFLLTGEDEFGRGNLCTASTLKVFDLLQTNYYISCEDLLHLQVILAIIGKENLIDKVYQFAQRNKNVLHFDPPLQSIDAFGAEMGLYIAGADFHLYTESELEEFSKRIKRMVTICNNDRDVCTGNQTKLHIPLTCLKTATSGSDVHLDEFEEIRCSTHKICRPYVVYCDIGIQTGAEINNIPTQLHLQTLEENKRLKEQLLDAEHNLQKKSNQITALQDTLKTDEDSGIHRPGDSMKNVPNDSNEVDRGDNIDATVNVAAKDIHYEMKALRIEHEIQTMTFVELSGLYESLKSDHEKVVAENKELMIEKTESDLQVAHLRRNFEGVEAKLRKHIEKENELIGKLRNELEMKTASLLNAQNDKRLHELSRLLEQISSMSMTVKKVYGNFDPAHEPISPQQDELFRKALSGKIGRIFPQIYYETQNK